MSSPHCAGSGVAVPGTLPTAARGRAADHLFLLRLASALAAQDPPVTLIVDDLHLLTEPAALGELEFVLRNVGPGLRLVVSSRMDPLLPLHRYRLAGELAEIRASDLAFSTGRGRPAAWPSTAARCRPTRWSASRGGRRAGRPASASPRSPWTLIPTPTSSSRS